MEISIIRQSLLVMQYTTVYKEDLCHLKFTYAGLWHSPLFDIFVYLYMSYNLVISGYLNKSLIYFYLKESHGEQHNFTGFGFFYRATLSSILGYFLVYRRLLALLRFLVKISDW